MADKEINDLTDGGAAQAGDLVHVVRSGNSRKVTLGSGASQAAVPFTAASSSGPASLDFHEDTDSGTNKVTLQASSALSGDVVATLPPITGTLSVRGDVGNKGTAIASAATLSIPDAVDFAHVTGTTTITDIDFSTARDGRMCWIEFDGVLTLTHNATTLNLPGSASIVTAAGDRALVVQDSSDNVHVLAYVRAASPPPVITPWMAYTPTFSGLGTVTNINVLSRRVGDTLQIRGSFQCGTTAASEARMNLGFNGTDGNVTSDATKVPAVSVAGIVARTGNVAGSFVTLVDSSVGYINFGIQSGSTGSLSKANGASIFASSTTVSITADVPISGW